MRALLIKCLAWLASWPLWAIHRLQPPPPPPPAVEISAVDAMADELVAWAETLEAGGEYKRHRVYDKLIRAFPNQRRCDLGLAIEIAVQKARKEQ